MWDSIVGWSLALAVETGSLADHPPTADVQSLRKQQESRAFPADGSVDLVGTGVPWASDPQHASRWPGVR